MGISATTFRKNLYQVLDRVEKTGEAAVIERHGRRFRIVLETPPDPLSKLVFRPDCLTCDPDEIIHMDWSGEWKP